MSEHHHHHHDHHHDHHHHHHIPNNHNRAFILGIALNLGFVAVESGAGIWTHSLALLADAGHNLSDVLGLVLAWGASFLSQRQPCQRYTYGWRRSSILAALFNALILLFVMGGIAWEAISRLQQPNAIPGQIIIIVAAIGVVINTLTALLFMADQKHDLNLKGAFLHMAGDALVSLGVVLAGIAILTTGWLWFDPVVSLIIVVVVIVGTWQLLLDAINLALDGVPRNVEIQAVKTYLQELVGVSEVHDLHIWAMSTTETALTAHLVMPEGCPGDGFLSETCEELHEHFGIGHSTLQVETGDANYPCSLAPEHKV